MKFAAARVRAGLPAAALGLDFTSVRRVDLVGSGLAGDAMVTTGDTEACVAVLGKAELSFEWRSPSGAASGTAGFKDMVFLPPRSELRLRSAAASESWAMVYEAPSELGAEFAHIRFATVDADGKAHHVYGKPATGSRRDVWNYVDAGFRCSRLMMGICRGQAGGWTAWPPHEHAAEREEVYVYFDMAEGFGVQCVYEDLDRPLSVEIVRDGDLIAIARGYHPNVGSPAGPISYVYCMCAKRPGRRNFMDLRIQKEFGDRLE